MLSVSIIEFVVFPVATLEAAAADDTANDNSVPKWRTDEYVDWDTVPLPDSDGSWFEKTARACGCTRAPPGVARSDL